MDDLELAERRELFRMELAGVTKDMSLGLDAAAELLPLQTDGWAFDCTAFCFPFQGVCKSSLGSDNQAGPRQAWLMGLKGDGPRMNLMPTFAMDAMPKLLGSGLRSTVLALDVQP